MSRRGSSGFNRLEASTAVQAIRHGLIMAMPLLMIGSFAMALEYLPIAAYQAFIASFMDGFFVDFFLLINRATFQILSVVMVVSISISYVRLKTNRAVLRYGAIFAALSSYTVFVGLFTEGFSMDALGSQGMFTAVFCAVFSSSIFCFLALGERFVFKLYAVGADSNFNNAVLMIAPIFIVLMLAVAIHGGITYFFGVTGFEELFQMGIYHLFSAIESRLLKVLLFILLIHLFWFFGVHGTNMLEAVAGGVYATELVGIGGTGLLTKEFLDVFVFMGGCGGTISLLVAILLFSKQKNNRGLAKMSAFPMLFNINELMLFGLPVVYNFSLMIPFLLTPLISLGTSLIAVTFGWVPLPLVAVEWTTPILFGGYAASGSLAGTVLQMFNIGLGVGVYGYFLRRYESKVTVAEQQDLKDLVRQMQRAEEENRQITLLDDNSLGGAVAKILAEDFKHMIQKSPEAFEVHYQPQFDYRERCIGAESLIRWKHPRFGIIYPPLLVGIANEMGLLEELEQRVFDIVARDVKVMDECGLLPYKISVNITARSLESEAFCAFAGDLMDHNPLLRGRLCIELTEQLSFTITRRVEEALEKLRTKGAQFAIDDFSMGYTSLKYLQSNQFDVVKLDGTLIRDITDNHRSQEIVASILHMSTNMQFTVIAEYVETVQQRKKLLELGCRYYQGYLYSPAISLDDFISYRRMTEMPQERETVSVAGLFQEEDD